MSTITLRATKGSPLTNTEVDSNFSNLNTDKLEATYSGAMNSLTGGTSIATVGTITSGTWSATAIGATKGGTGQTTYATGDLLYASAANTLSKLAKPAVASYLKMAADGTPSWDTLGLDDITAVGTVTVGAWNADVIGSTYGGTGVNNGGRTITLNTGNLTLTAQAGGSSVTVPSTGTLATLAGSEAFTNKTYNGLSLTAASVGFTVAGGTTSKTLTVSNTLTFSGTDASSVAFGTGGTVAYTNVTSLASLTTVGTIGTGVWQGTDIGLAYGGTNATLTAVNGGIVYSTASAMAITSAGTSGQVLVSSGAGAPTWTTPSYASTGKAIAMAIVFGG